MTEFNYGDKAAKNSTIDDVIEAQIARAFESILGAVLTSSRRDELTKALQIHVDGAECPNPEEAAQQMFDEAAAVQQRRRNSQSGNVFEMNALCLLAANAIHRLRRGNVPGAVNSLCELVRIGAVFRAYAVIEASNPVAKHSKDSAIRTNRVIDRYRELNKESGLNKDAASQAIFDEHIVPWSQQVIRNALKGVDSGPQKT